MSEQNATNISWHEHHINKAERAGMKHQKPCVLWFTGLSGSGKSTAANALDNQLYQLGYHTYLLDGDNIRHGLNKNLGFSPEDRAENIRRIGEVAKLFVDAGLIVMTAFISPYREDRDRVRALFEEGEFLEVFVDTPLEVCEQRDPKGLYRKARAGVIKQFTGIDAPYEKPERPEVTLVTADRSIDVCTSHLVEQLRQRHYIT